MIVNANRYTCVAKVVRIFMLVCVVFVSVVLSRHFTRNVLPFLILPANVNVSPSTREKALLRPLLNSTFDLGGASRSDVLDSTISSFDQRGTYSSKVDNNNNFGNLLDFVIAGFPKTGTTTLMNQTFSVHPEIAIPRNEVHLMRHHQIVDMVELLRSLRPGERVLRGYKAPTDIASIDVLDVLDEFFPTAKLIVGVRHPIRWFESYYNFKLRANFTLPPPELLDGECLRDMVTKNEKAKLFKEKLNRTKDQAVCADRARFHVRLSWLGKTNVHSVEENALLGPSRRHILASRAPIRNPVFLYDFSQLSETNRAQHLRFLGELQKYLGLKAPFEPADRPPISHSKESFDICEDKYSKLRGVLLRIGLTASTWIRGFFMKHPDVTVPFPREFEAALLKWHDDPCNERQFTNH